MRTLCGWGACDRECVKIKILPIWENVEKAALFGARLFANYELRIMNCELRIVNCEL